MIYTLQNQKLKVNISTLGAELQNILLKSDNTEYLWQGNPEFWSGKAYNLFPICGRLLDGKYTFNDSVYEMGIHGFLRSSETYVSAHTSDSITFTLTENEDIFKIYPFKFRLDITYILDDTKIITRFNVLNTDSQNIYFSVGGHPGFNVPLCDGEDFSDYFLEFDTVSPLKLIKMSKRGLLLDSTVPFSLENGKILRLSHGMFDFDALFFTDISPAITLKSVKSDKKVRLEYDGFQNIGIWHTPNSKAPYVCIEPWTSLPAYDFKTDDLASKYQMTSLAPSQSYQNEFSIIIS